MGKDILYNAFRREETDVIPWVPFVGCHAGKLIGMPADKYLCSEELIFRGVFAAIENYKPDGIPVAFDFQLEAEAFGITRMPAVIITENKLKSEGELPSVDVIREWIKSI